MEELDKVKSIRKVRMKSGAKYLFVFRVPHIMTRDQRGALSAGVKRFGERLEKKMGIIFEPLILERDMTLDIVEKEEATSNRKKRGPVTPSERPGTILPFGEMSPGFLSKVFRRQK